TFTPLESPKGRDASWKVRAVVDSPAAYPNSKVQGIQKNGTKLQPSDIATIRPAIDAAFVTPATPVAGAKPSPFAKYTSSSNYLTGEQDLTAYVIGGGTRNFFWHNPKYAAIEYCQVKVVNVPFGEKPPAPVCDPLQPTKFVILERDLGST